jgi:hypothetical protein
MTTKIDPITNAQIDEVADLFANLCRKNAVSLPKEVVQQIIEEDGDALAKNMFETLLNKVELLTVMIVRKTNVNRDQTPATLVAATGRVPYLNDKVLETMPRLGEGNEEVDVYFFKVGKYVKVGDLDHEYEIRGLVPDHYAQAQVNTDDPTFAKEHPNCSQWDCEDGKSSYLTFGQDGGGRGVGCSHRSGHVWDAGWWFAGRRPRKSLEDSVA